MSEVLRTLLDGLHLLFYIYIWLQFLTKTLCRRYKKSTTFIVIILFFFLYGQVNVIFVIAGTSINTALYYCIGYILLCTILFRDDLIKIAFLVVLFYCGYQELFYPLIPLLYTQSEFMIAAVPFISLLLFSLLVKWIGKKFQNLQYELPRALSAYLLFVTLFVFISTAVITELSRMAKYYYTLPLPLSVFFHMFAVCGILVMVFAVFTIDKQIAQRLSEKGLAIQLAGLKEREESFRRLSEFRHDIKNHMICLENLLKNEKHDQALLYLSTLTDTVKQMDKGITTGNDFSDAIINEKAAIIEEKKITFREDISLPPECRIEPVELCCIFSNLLDNAIHACDKISYGDKWIHASAFVRQSQLVIVIENSMAENDNKQGTTPPLKEGTGLSNVRRVIEKNGGTMDISNDKIFSFSAMVPLDWPLD